MKKLLLILITVFTLSSCDKGDENPQNPIDQLPPATQTGTNTFGCLLDGQAFIPSGGTNPLDCVYQLVNGGYYFSLQGNKRDANNNLILIGISTNNLQITENQSFNLIENIALNAYGTYAFNAMFSNTNNINTGELKITKLDTQNQIVSGTFWFDILHPTTNLVVRIREGRFDMQYTQ